MFTGKVQVILQMSTLVNDGMSCACAGQSYEIKVKKLGDLSEYQGKCLRVSVHGNATVLDMFRIKSGSWLWPGSSGTGLTKPHALCCPG